jgi:lysophospholipase L1-like esterase
MSFSKYTAALAVVILSACGGGGGGSPAAPIAKAAPTPIAIEMIGDSTMVGATYPNGPCGASPTTGICDPSTQVTTPDNAPANMAQILQQAGAPVTVTNAAISGTAIVDLINGKNGYAPWAQMLPTINARVIVLNFGINDTQRADETPSQYSAYLTQWIASVRAAGKVPVLEEPNPVCRVGYETLPDYVAQMDAVAAQQGVLLIQQYAHIQSLPDWQGMMSDCVHPRPALYEIKGQREAAILAPLIRSLEQQ